MQTMQGTYSSFLLVTKSDTTQITCKAIYIGGTGDIAVKQGVAGASAVTFSAVPVGTILPIALDRGQIMSTNTTATLIIALS